MLTETQPAPSLDSEAALSAILALVVAEREARSTEATSPPAREESVIDRARAVLTAAQKAAERSA